MEYLLGQVITYNMIYGLYTTQELDTLLTQQNNLVNPLYNKLAGWVEIIQQTQRYTPQIRFIDVYDVNNPYVDLPTAGVNVLTSSPLNYVVTTIPGAPVGLQRVTKIDWSVVTPDHLFPIYTRVVGGSVTTTGQVLTDITGLTQTLQPNSIYEIEASLSVQTSNVTTGTGYGINYTGTANIEGQIIGSTTATASKQLRINANNTPATGFLIVSNLTGGIFIKLGISTTTTGTLSIRHLKTTSGTSTVFPGSYLKIAKIT